MPIPRLTSILVMTLGTIRTALMRTGISDAGMVGWRLAMKRTRKSAAILVDPWTHLEVVKVLRRREVRPVVDAAPRMMFKYLSDYLKSDLSRKERASILVHHYALLSDRADETFFRTIVDRGLELWRELIDGHAYRIVLTFPRTNHDEGDLALVFRADGTDLYTLSFTCGSGSIAGLGATNVMYIARVQGRGRALEPIRLATKDCGDISPAALLLAAAEGIAMELGLERIVGMSAMTQLSADKSRPGGLVTAYDEFWMSFGGQRLQGGMFELLVPRAEKPLTSIKRCHRSRVRRKRVFKKLVREQVRADFRDSIVRGAAEAH